MFLACGSTAAGELTARQSSDQQPTFRGGISLVPVDVRVVDAGGRPVAGLTAANFSVFENGVPQRIQHFAAQSLTPDSSKVTSARPLRAVSDGPPNLAAADRRVFLLVLGRGRLQVPAKAIDGLLHFVRERLLPQDQVAVIAYDRATDFTTDRAATLEVLERFKKAHEGIEGKLKLALSGLAAIYGSRQIPTDLRSQIDAIFSGPRSGGVRTLTPVAAASSDRLERDHREAIEGAREEARAQANTSGESLDLSADATLDDYLAAHTQTMQDVGNLYAGIEYLRHVDGEKHLLFLSESGILLPRAEDDKNLAHAASDARVAIDYFLTGGVPTAGVGIFSAETRGGGRAMAPAGFARGRGRGSATGLPFVAAAARDITNLTGGRLYVNQFSSTARALDDLDGATRTSYLLAYVPSNPVLDGRYRNITVRVNQPGVAVQYRRGYFAREVLPIFTRAAAHTYGRVTSALGYAGDIGDIAVNAAAASDSGGPGLVRVEGHIDLARVKFSKTGTRNAATLEFAAAAIASNGTVVGHLWQTLQLSFSDERLVEVLAGRMVHRLQVETSAPARDIRVVVYDQAGDLLGSTTVRIKTP